MEKAKRSPCYSRQTWLKVGVLLLILLPLSNYFRVYSTYIVSYPVVFKGVWYPYTPSLYLIVFCLLALGLVWWFRHEHFGVRLLVVGLLFISLVLVVAITIPENEFFQQSVCSSYGTSDKAYCILFDGYFSVERNYFVFKNNPFMYLENTRVGVEF